MCFLGARRFTSTGHLRLNIVVLRRHDRKKPWDMARAEQVLVLEPQHELKFRGNAKMQGRAGVRWLK